MSRFIDHLIDKYNFRLPENNPDSGAVMCDYFEEIEDDPLVREFLETNMHEIIMELRHRRIREENYRKRRNEFQRIK